MRTYWKQAYRIYRLGLMLPLGAGVHAAWNATQLCAGPGATWPQAIKIFEALKIAKPSTQIWLRGGEQ